MAGIQITIPNYFVDVGDVPVRVDIRDATLDLVESIFIPFGSSDRVTAGPGMYVIEAELPSGQRLHEVVTIDDNGDVSVDLDTGMLSPHEFHAWAYLNKNATHPPKRSLGEAKFEGAWVRLWRKDDDQGWQTVESEFAGSSTWNGDGVNYDLESFGGMQFLQVGGPNIPWKLIALPGSQQLRILIRAANGPTAEVHPLDVIVSTRNAGAEAILSLLTRGSVDRAKGVEAAGAAEFMLHAKMADPAAAAIGGYYLLRIGDLNRLHDWTLNLANWIDWMADGPIIRAWHVLKDARLRGAKHAQTRKRARTFLLQAVERGVPIYTEGLMLLRDGINMLSHDRGDTEIQSAKTVVDGYTHACDWAAPTTTFLGASPAEPSPEPILGKPDAMANLVFLFNVDPAELIRQGIIRVGGTLNLDSLEQGLVEVHVEQNGKLNLDGKLYNTFGHVAAKVGLSESSQSDWRSAESGESIYQGLDNLRHGKLSVHTALASKEGW